MKKIRLLVVAMMAALIGLASCGGGGVSKNATPGEAVEKFYQLVQKEDYAGAAKMFAGNGKLLTGEETTKIEGMIGMAATEYKEKDGIQSITIIEENISDDQQKAKVRFDLVFGNGEKDRSNQSLEKVDGKWYLNLITQ